jgi:hypothetical protein
MARNSDLPMMTDENGVACSWCPETEEYTNEGLQGQLSHGICEGHSTIMRMRRQVGKVPSYATQREQFEEYRRNRGR